MNISFICNPVYIDGGWSPWSTRIGGSEECIVETSWRLAKNHKVKVFHNGKHGTYKNVEYLPHEKFEPGDITINVNYPEFISPGKSIFWSSLTKHPDLSHFDIICGITDYAIQNTGLPSESIILPPGYDKDKIYPEKKISKQCFYASSPDRGLSTLLEAWPKVHATIPEATLIITYGGLADLDGIINLGVVDTDTMSEIYRTSEYWCHPANGGELYCMTGVKAQAAQCIPVVIPTMALQETVKDGIFATADNYADKLIEALTLDDISKQTILNNLKLQSYPDWEYTTNRLLSIINDVVKLK